MSNPSTSRVIQKAVAACRSFAQFQNHFFDFEQSARWRGWENWLTVDICRRLNDKDVHPFSSYDGELNGKHMDFSIGVRSSLKVAVEIKVNYIDKDEAKQKTELPDRVLNDRDKLNSCDKRISRLLLVSTCFQSRESMLCYRVNINPGLAKDFLGWSATWHDCSMGNGYNLLLALIWIHGPGRKTLCTLR